MSRVLSRVSLALLLVFGICVPSMADYGLKSGTPKLQQAGSLAFGPDGILFVGDSMGATVFAIATGDTDSSSAGEVNIEGINGKIAAMLGTTAQQTMINDIAVNPLSGKVYLSVSRGRGPDAIPVLLRVDAKGSISEFSLDNVKYAKASFENAPESRQGRRGNPRMSAITDLQYTNGKLIAAGLSNEEFASKLRVFDFPFNGSDSATSIEVYHGAHGKLETHSPVRTFITYENTVLAAYTCTPLVTIPVDDLQGEKIMGKTVAELGNRNNPLDMIVYTKGDQDYLLLNNSSRGVMKMKLNKQELDEIDAIESRVGGGGTAGIGYETLSQFENVSQLDKLNDELGVMLVASSDNQLNLQTFKLP